MLRSLKAHEEPVNDAIGLIELYSGISGGRQALCLVGINPGVHVMSDVNQGAARASGMAWPKVIRWADVTDINEEKVRTLLQYGLHVKLWIVIGASHAWNIQH